MSPAGPLPRGSHRSPQGEGEPADSAGPLPRGSHRSPAPSLGAEPPAATAAAPAGGVGERGGDIRAAGARPPRQSRTGLTSTGARKAGSKSARSRAREFGLQALYQHLVGRNPVAEIDVFTRDLAGFSKCDSVHFDALLTGCVRESTALDALIVPLLDRKLEQISPVERATMWIGVYEFQHCLDVPWRVVLNECIELAKEFGGTDGHKYVNAVLNGIAPGLRASEVARDRSAGRTRVRTAVPSPSAHGAPENTQHPDQSAAEKA